MAERFQSFKVGIKTKHTKDWTFNGLRFASSIEAEAYANDVQRRWRMVIATVIWNSYEPPNARFPVPSETYDVPRVGEHVYRPRQIDIDWAKMMVASIKDGGVLSYPSTELVYRVRQTQMKLILENPQQLAHLEALIVHLRTVATFAEIGWKVEGG